MTKLLGHLQYLLSKGGLELDRMILVVFSNRSYPIISVLELGGISLFSCLSQPLIFHPSHMNAKRVWA